MITRIDERNIINKLFFYEFDKRLLTEWESLFFELLEKSSEEEVKLLGISFPIHIACWKQLQFWGRDKFFSKFLGQAVYTKQIELLHQEYVAFALQRRQERDG